MGRGSECKLTLKTKSKPVVRAHVPYRGIDLDAAARDSSLTCGAVLRVILFPVASLSCSINQPRKGQKRKKAKSRCQKVFWGVIDGHMSSSVCRVQIISASRFNIISTSCAVFNAPPCVNSNIRDTDEYMKYCVSQD